MEGCSSVTADQLDVFGQAGRLFVAGFSNSGKTTFVTSLCNKYHNKFSKIIVSTTINADHPLSKHPLLRNKITPIQGLINPSDYQDPISKEPILYIIDDLYLEAIQSPIIANIFTRGRHDNISVILISQNLFPQGKYARTITLNCSHYILMRQRDMNQLEILGGQLFGRKTISNFVEIYRRATSLSKYGYLLVDLMAPEPLQLRTCVVDESQCEIVYQL